MVRGGRKGRAVDYCKATVTEFTAAHFNVDPIEKFAPMPGLLIFSVTGQMQERWSKGLLAADKTKVGQKVAR